MPSIVHSAASESSPAAQWRSGSGRLAGRRRTRILGVLSAVFGMLAVWAFFLEPRRLVVHREALDVPSWRPELAGLRVALISDLHVGSPYWGLDRLRSLVATTNAEQPDLVLLAGDYTINGVAFGTKIAPEAIAEVLGGLRAPLGVVAVLGNHDWIRYGDRIRAAFSSRGIVVLDNEVHVVQRGGRLLFLVGLADEIMRPQSVARTVESVPSGETSLVLVHEPDVFMNVGPRPSLTLAGHTHGGQVVLPLLGRPVVSSIHGERLAAGHVVDGGRHLFVTTGVGTSIFPVRFGVPPEVAILTLN